MTEQAELPRTMRCIEIAEPGGPDVLRLATRPLPTPSGGEVLLRVAYAGVNRPDVLQRSGLYPPPDDASDLPGLEVSGTVVELGSPSAEGDIALGDEVMALVPGGGYAEYVRVPSTHCIHRSNKLSMAQAAAIPETLFTVWHNVMRLGGLCGGETLLVHGGSSGIGTTAIQIARAAGAEVIATASSPTKIAAIEALGATGVNYREADFVDRVRELTEGRGADVILDMVGGDYVERNYRVAAVEGRVVQIATLGGAKATANTSLLMTKRLTHTGSTLRPRSDAFKASLADELKREALPLIEQGAFKPIMDRTFPLEGAADAHRRMEAGDHIGKIVLRVSKD